MTAMTDRLAAIAAQIDSELADERAGRQEIAENAARRIRAVVRSLSRAKDSAPALPSTGTYGPFDDDRAASAASSWAREGRPQGRMQDLGERDLVSACQTAGVVLGAHDRRTLRWLAGFEPASAAVVAGLIIRASAAAVIDNATVRRALADAVAYCARRIEACAECASNPETPWCHECASLGTWKLEYEALLTRLGSAL